MNDLNVRVRRSMKLESLGNVLMAVLVVASLASCSRSKAPAPAVAKQAAAAQCEGADVHTRHINQFACETCHPKGGEFAAAGTLPDGTPVSGTITRGTPTSCTVTCHGTQPVTWDQPGPLACLSCHPQAVVAGARSTHVTGTDRAACLLCHDTSAHLSGTPRLVVGDGTPGNAACLACHSGTGRRLGDKAPPLVTGFGAGGADAHGDAGAEPARACADCHDPHASSSAFLLGRRSDPAPLPTGAVASREGIGAQALCGRCHATRHASCGSDCHANHVGVVNWHASDPVPDGGACFACHGHEGVVHGDERQTGYDSVSEWEGFYTPGDCRHCHLTNLPPVEAVPPDIATPRLTTDGVSTATVTWTSVEPASSYVEWRTTDAPDVVHVAGDPLLRKSHSVQLTGLAPSQTIEWRIRTSDRMRNVGWGASGIATVAAPNPPVLTKVVDFRTCAFTAPVRFAWSASTDPNGAPVAYELQVSLSSLFDTLVTTATTDAGVTSSTATLDTPNAGRRYYWRVRARVAPDGLASAWSAVENFWARQDYDLCL